LKGALRFRPAHRLRDAASFKAVFDARQAVGTKHFVFLLRRNGQQVARLGMVIGRRQLSQAVQRNRLRRLIREVFRHRQTRLSGWDVVVKLKHADGLDAPAAELDRGFERVSAWAESPSG
jgi:ribonuclease P protein component